MADPKNWVDVVLGVAGAVGTIGGGISGLTLKRFVNAETLAHKAFAATEDLRKVFDDTKRAFKLELDDFKEEVKRKVRNGDDRDSERPSRISRPDVFAVENPDALQVQLQSMLDKIKHLENQVDALKSELLRERGQRHAIQHTIAENAREDSKRWQDLNRLLGQIEGQMMKR